MFRVKVRLNIKTIIIIITFFVLAIIIKGQCVFGQEINGKPPEISMIDTSVNETVINLDGIMFLDTLFTIIKDSISYKKMSNCYLLWVIEVMDTGNLSKIECLTISVYPYFIYGLGELLYNSGRDTMIKILVYDTTASNNQIVCDNDTTYKLNRCIISNDLDTFYCMYPLMIFIVTERTWSILLERLFDSKRILYFPDVKIIAEETTIISWCCDAAFTIPDIVEGFYVKYCINR